MTANDQWDRNDRYWEHATRSAYRPLNAIEQAALLPLCVEWHHRPLADRDTAAVPQMRDDGVAVLVKLTVERVEAYAAAYWDRQPWTAQQFGFPADA